MPESRVTVEVLYSVTAWVGWRDDNVTKGGYLARIPGFHEQGNGVSVEDALRELARELAGYVLDWEADAEAHGWATNPDDCKEPPLVGWTRERLLKGDLLQRLLELAGEPVLEAGEEDQLPG